MVRRIILIGIALLAAAIVGSFSLAVAASRSQPFVAAQLAPYLADPQSRMAAMTLAAGQAPANLNAAEQLARKAVARNPIDPIGLRTLGFILRQEKQDRAADRTFALVNRLTRRDPVTNLDLIVQAARRQDVKAAINQFDIGLKTSRRSWDTFFPIIYQISADPRVVPELARVLDGNPQWKWPFLDGLVRNGPDPRVAAHLFDALERKAPLGNDDIQRMLISRLLETKNFPEAAARFGKFVREKNVASPTNGNFERSALDLPLEWNPAPATDFETGIAANQDKSFGKSFFFRVPPEREGELLRITAILPAGQHTMTFAVGPVLEGKAGTLTLGAECLDGGSSLADEDIPAPRPGRHAFTFNVPLTCGGIRLTIRAGSAGGSNPWVTWLDDINY